MKGSTAVLLLGLALCVATAQAQDKKTDIVTALSNNGHKLAVAVLEVAGVTKHASDPKAKYTFLLPTDAAIESFLKGMGLTVDEFKKRPALAKQLVAQHTLLNSNVREQEIFEKGESRKAATLASRTGLGLGNDDVEFKRTAPGKFTVTDPQGNTANVVGKPFHPDENKTIIPIDRVLMGDQYYFSFADVCKHRKDRVSAFCDAVKTAGLGDALTASKLDATVFVPNNDAFKKATEKGAPSKEALATILKYHVVPGARELPKGWKQGASEKTLEGKDLKVNYERKSAEGTKAKFDWAEARVVPADGKGVPVLRSNVHVGKAIVHGIGSVLVPTAAPAVTTEKAAAAAPAKPAAPAPAKTGSRRLLDWGWGMSAGPTAAQDDVSSQIAAAVAGNESVANVAKSSTLQAEELSVPGDYNQVMNGINPW